MSGNQPTHNQNNIIYGNKPLVIDNTKQNLYPNIQNYNIDINKDYNYQNLPMDSNLQYSNNQYMKNDAYFIQPNDVQQNVYNIGPTNNNNYVAKTNFEKIENYYIDPKTGEKILIHGKYNNKTHKPTVNIEKKIYNEVYLSEPIKEINEQNLKNIQINESNDLSPLLENLDINATIEPIEEGEIHKDDILNDRENVKMSASVLSVSVLSDIQYKDYPKAKHSFEALGNISGFGVNSYNGKIKNFNEDRIRVVASSMVSSKKNPNKKFRISYFSIFDGHAGRQCSEFLKKNFYEYLMKSPLFPDEPIRAIKETFIKAESEFYKLAYDPNTKKLKDKSGSCALIMVIIDNILYSVNLGDSRALYSYDTGRYLFQITRDHKPNDETEKKRIEKAGGSIYYANTIVRKGKEIKLKEKDFGEGFTFPYRVKPGGLAVSNNYI